MSTLTLKELSAPTGEVIKIAAGKTLDLNSQGTLVLPTIPHAKMPTGSVLQIVSNTLTTVGTTTSSTLAALGLSQAITPISTSSKIYATVTGSAKTHNDVGTIYTIYRGGTDLKIGGSGMTVIYGGSTGAMTTSFAIQVLDSPNTASAVTYSVYWRTRDNGNTSQNNWLGGETTITLMEIAG